MMKKLLVLMMVFGMASMASAVPIFRISPNDLRDHYAPSDWITIELYDDGSVIGYTVDAIQDAIGGVSPAGGMASGETFVVPATWSLFPGTLNSNDMLVEYMGASPGVPVEPTTGVIYSFEYHVPQVPVSTNILIESYYDGDWYLAPEIKYSSGPAYTDNIVLDGVIHVIPEPATIALLGLGGLLLRRHKK